MRCYFEYQSLQSTRFCHGCSQRNIETVKIVDCKPYVRSVEISPSVFIARNKAMEDVNAKYPIRRAICKTYDTYIPTVNLAHTQGNLFTQLSTRIVIAWLRGSTTTLSTDATPKTRTIADIPSRPPCLGDFKNPGQLRMDFFTIFGFEVKEFNADTLTGMQSN